MIYHKCDARSEEWFKLRLGRPTASEFHRIVTAGGKDGKKAKASEQAEGYAHRLLAELMLGKVLEEADFQSQYMQRGQDLEDKAIEAYEFITEVETTPGGFITDDLGRYGCSPDRLVGPDRLLEIKIPAASTHIRYLVDPESIKAEKRPQAQGQLLCSERDSVDLVSFHPEMPLAVVKTYRDDEYIARLRDALNVFCDTLQAMRENLERTYGPFRPIAVEPPVVDGFGISDEDIDSMIEQGAIEI